MTTAGELPFIHLSSRRTRAAGTTPLCPTQDEPQQPSPQDQEPAGQLADIQPLADAQEAHKEVTALQDMADSATPHMHQTPKYH